MHGALVALVALVAPALAAQIQFAGGICLETYPFRGASTAVVEGCTGRPDQAFDELERGATRVKVRGQDQCLDAGDAPANGALLAFRPCDRRAASQQWWLTDDGRLALAGQGMCVDLPDGWGENLSSVQIWACGDGNRNQEWTIV